MEHRAPRKRHRDAQSKFKQMDSFASEANNTNLSTVHQNTITCLKVHKENGKEVAAISSTGLDGKLVIWDLVSCGVNNMKL